MVPPLPRTISFAVPAAPVAIFSFVNPSGVPGLFVYEKPLALGFQQGVAKPQSEVTSALITGSAVDESYMQNARSVVVEGSPMAIGPGPDHFHLMMSFGP